MKNMDAVKLSQIPTRTLFSGEQIPAVGLGTFGSDKYTAEEVAQAVEGAVKAGYRLIDCAAVYGNEARIGEVLHRLLEQKAVTRQELFITSKVWNDMHRQVETSCDRSLAELQLSYIDLYFVHWPFPNYHAPGCGGDARNPDSQPFSPEEFMDTWRQCESLVQQGKVRYLGMSNMTVPKLEAVLPLCKIPPAALEMELHPSFQQQELYEYALAHRIQPIGYCPMGSPSRPERDRTPEDVCDFELPAVQGAARRHGLHPAQICLKWAVQRGQIPIPFSVKEAQYVSNLACLTEDPLTPEEMEDLRRSDRNCRLVKGQVFLWPGASSWEELWDPEEDSSWKKP